MGYNVFNKNGTVRVSNDGNTPLCTLTASNGAHIPDAFFVMNFENVDTADYQMTKALDQEFMFTSFGNAAVTVSLSGFQAETIINDSTGTAKNLTRSRDAEHFYRKYNIGSKHRALMKIATSISKASGVYKGYMVGFRKQPQGEEKINGYAFTIQLICWREDV